MEELANVLARCQCVAEKKCWGEYIAQTFLESPFWPEVSWFHDSDQVKWFISAISSVYAFRLVSRHYTGITVTMSDARRTGRRWGSTLVARHSYVMRYGVLSSWGDEPNNQTRFDDRVSSFKHK